MEYTKYLSAALMTVGLVAAAGCENAGPDACIEGTKYDEESESCVPDPKACGSGMVLQGTTCVAQVPAGPGTADDASEDSTAGGDDAGDAGDGGPWPPLDALTGDGPAACVPGCGSAKCGVDPCGYSCGICDSGLSCQEGKCVTCTPDCKDKECGSDGCNGFCGNCSGYLTCSPAGKCVLPPECLCQDNNCGLNPCGKSCGSCPAGKDCYLNECKPLDAADSCLGKCGTKAQAGGCSCDAKCKATDTCCADVDAACGCVKDCDGLSCGDDGCGGSCGTCKAGTQCLAGECQPDPCSPDPCNGHGVCSQAAATFACACAPGFAGKTCKECAAGLTGYPACVPSPCSVGQCGVGGTCDPVTGACLCKPGFKGPTCGACKFDAEVFPACTCSGSTCAKCKTGGCADLDPCSTDDCNSDGQCTHVSACPGGKLDLAQPKSAWSGSSPTAVAPLVLSLPGVVGGEIKVWREGTAAAMVPTIPPTAKAGGTSVSSALGEIKVQGPLKLFALLPEPDKVATGTVKLMLSQPATAAGAGRRAVLLIGGLGGPGEGPTMVLSDVPLEAAGTFPAYFGSQPAEVVGAQALVGHSGGTPSSIHAFVLKGGTQAVTLTLQQPTDGAPDGLVLGIGVAEFIQACDSEKGQCVQVGPTCGDGVVAAPEACDDGDVNPGDGCSPKCLVEPGYNCSTLALGSSCGQACQANADCAKSQVFWNSLSSLAGQSGSLKSDNPASTIEFSVPMAFDGKADALGITLSATGGGGVELPVSTYTPPNSLNASFVDPQSGLEFGWKGAMGYLDFPVGTPWASTLRFQFSSTAAMMGPDYFIVIGIAGTSGAPEEGPTTITSSVPLVDFGKFDGFSTGKYPQLKSGNTIVGSKTVGAFAPDGYRFVTLPVDAAGVDLAISSPAADPHGYLVGVARIRKRVCTAGVCAGAGNATCGDGVVEPLEACDDGGKASGDGCSGSCAVEPGWTCKAGAAGSSCTKPTCVPLCGGKLCGSDGCGGSCGTCDDANGCTADSCTAAGQCQFDPHCSAGAIIWSDLKALTGASSPSQASPLAIPLATPVPTLIKLWRSDSAPVSPQPVPAQAISASAAPVAPWPVGLSWAGNATLVSIGNNPGKPMEGTLNLAFDKAAGASGAGWRYILGVTRLGGSGQGPLSVVSNVALQPVGSFDLWGTAATATWDAAAKTLKGPTGGSDSRLQLFALPADAVQLQLSLQQAGGGADVFAIVVGAVGVGQKCEGVGALAQCGAFESACGDAVVAGGEGCDDGNTKPGDGCGPKCEVEASFACQTAGFMSFCKGASSPHPCDLPGVCGAGSYNGPAGECWCDAACLSNGDCCTASGTLGPSCAGSNCSACQAPASVCGDGVLADAEECDDKNKLDGDGCSGACKVESGFNCVSPVDINTGSDGLGGQAQVGSADLKWQSAQGADWASEGAAGDATALAKTPALPPSGLVWKPAGVVSKCVSAWYDSVAPAPSQWISTEGWNSTLGQCNNPPLCTAGSLYYYKVSFTLPSAGAAAGTSLAGKLWADNQVTRIWLNGKKVTEYADPPPGSSNFTGGGISFAGWKGYFKKGVNEMVVAVANFTSPACPNPQGLLVSVDSGASSQCTK